MGVRIFLSYARDDFKRVQRYYLLLKKHGHAPWMDKKSLQAGQDWESGIVEAISSSNIVIFFLSGATSRGDRYFQRELKYVIEGLNNRLVGLKVIPACLDDCHLPMGLEKFHRIDLFESGGQKKLLEDIKEINAKSWTSLSRSTSVSLGSSAIKLPCFFPAISSTAKSTLSVIDHLKFLVTVDYSQFLVSAFDIYETKTNSQKSSREVMNLIYIAHGKNKIILLDSGNYEKYWRKLDWWKRKHYIEVLGYLPIELAFCYDNLKPSENSSEVIKEIETSFLRDQRDTDLKNILPIVHSKSPDDIAYICKEVVTRLKPRMIAVPERELGDGIFRRGETVTKIREKMNSTGVYYPLHILGTGNPLSILLLVACGADSFDGLEWCQTSVDNETGRLYHSQLADFFFHQSPIGKTDMGFTAKTLSHNLMFYSNWMEAIRKNIESDKLDDMLKLYLPPHAYDECRNRFEGYQKI